MQVLAVSSLAHVSGKPEDRIQNTFCFEYPGAYDPAKDQLIADAITRFWNTIPSGGVSAWGKRLNDSVSRAASAGRIDVYSINEHLDGSPHGSPLDTFAFTLTTVGAAGAGLPAEVAITGSFHAAYGLLAEEVANTRPKNRRRGRIYLGPLTFDTIDQDATTKRVFVKASTRLDLSRAMTDLMTDSNTNWCVWSRKDQLTMSVVGGHVDDAFDTHRSRGERSILRTTFGA